MTKKDKDLLKLNDQIKLGGRIIICAWSSFALGALSGIFFMAHAYNPAVLEENVLRNVKTVYVAGCTEGIRSATGKNDSMVFCMDAAEKTVQDHRDIFLNKIWDKK